MQRLADRPNAKARMKRRGYPIHAYVGPNGTGKSALMVYDTLTSLRWGRPVLSTVRLLDYNNPRPCPGGAACDDPENHDRELIVTDLRLVNSDDPLDPAPDPAAPTTFPMATKVGTGVTVTHQAAHPLYVRFTDYQQLLEWRDGDVLMDEVTGVASSRDSMSGMPTQVANLLVQLRRRNVVLRWSAPSWSRADKIIREVTQAATLTVGHLGRKRPPAPGEAPRLWREKRLFVARTFDAQLLDEFDARRAAQLKPIVQAAYWGPGSQMFTAYDTYEPVTSLGWANDAGLCMHCGGKRATVPCGCDDYKELKRNGRQPAAVALLASPLPPPGRLEPALDQPAADVALAGHP